MSSQPFKKCFNCRLALPDDAVNTVQCLKCQKNEARYGKPGTCQYCKLNAAFHDQRCVWCSHAERKFGSPFTCANCKLRCAFPRRESDKSEDAALLCRLCILQARHTNQTVLAGIPVPPEKPEKAGEGTSTENRSDRDRDSRRSSHHNRDNKEHHRRDEKRHHRDREGVSSNSHHRHAQKRRHNDDSNNNGSNGNSSSGASALIPNNENGNEFPQFGERDHGESIAKQQKMEDEIRRLKAQIQEKEQLLFEKDKQISNLKADQYNIEKKHRERVQQLIKEKEESIRAMELVRNSKSSKKN